MPPFRICFLIICCILGHTTVTLARRGMCPESTTPILYEMDGYEMAIPVGDLVYVGLRRDECTEMCLDNQDYRGDRVVCAGVTYYRGNCTVSVDQVAPEGRGIVKMMSGATFYQKDCIKTSVAEQGFCDRGVFIRKAQVILSGYAYDALPVSSINECLNACVESPDFSCKSALYFYNDNECILNAESASLLKSSNVRLTSENEDKVVYIENPCGPIIEESVSLGTCRYSRDCGSDSVCVATTKGGECRCKIGFTKRGKSCKPTQTLPVLSQSKSRSRNIDLVRQLAKQSKPRRLGHIKSTKPTRPVEVVSVPPVTTEPPRERSLQRREFEHSAAKPLAKPSSKPSRRKEGTFSNWSIWSPCDFRRGLRIRIRKCVGGQVCRGSYVDTDRCQYEGWSDWSAPCEPFAFPVEDPCLGFQLRVCMGGVSGKCQGAHFRYCFFEECQGSDKTLPATGGTGPRRHPVPQQRQPAQRSDRQQPILPVEGTHVERSSLGQPLARSPLQRQRPTRRRNPALSKSVVPLARPQQERLQLPQRHSLDFSETYNSGSISSRRVPQSPIPHAEPDPLNFNKS